MDDGLPAFFLPKYDGIWPGYHIVNPSCRKPWSKSQSYLVVFLEQFQYMLEIIHDDKLPNVWMSAFVLLGFKLASC